MCANMAIKYVYGKFGLGRSERPGLELIRGAFGCWCVSVFNKYGDGTLYRVLS